MEQKEAVIIGDGPAGLAAAAALWEKGIRDLLIVEAAVLAMGCRERTRGALGIPGDRPSGVFTAGVAQAYLSLYNRMVGKEIVILGSGDIGMIMARRLTLEGAHVQAVLKSSPSRAACPGMFSNA